MSGTDLNFHIGDKVVYPNHGVGVIEQISSRSVGPTVEKFYLLHIKAGSYLESSTIGARTEVGPYAHLRPDSQVGEGCKVGRVLDPHAGVTVQARDRLRRPSKVGQSKSGAVVALHTQ